MGKDTTSGLWEEVPREAENKKDPREDTGFGSSTVPKHYRFGRARLSTWSWRDPAQTADRLGGCIVEQC